MGRMLAIFLVVSLVICSLHERYVFLFFFFKDYTPGDWRQIMWGHFTERVLFKDKRVRSSQRAGPSFGEVASQLLCKNFPRADDPAGCALAFSHGSLLGELAGRLSKKISNGSRIQIFIWKEVGSRSRNWFLLFLRASVEPQNKVEARVPWKPSPPPLDPPLSPPLAFISPTYPFIQYILQFNLSEISSDSGRFPSSQPHPCVLSFR